MILDKVGLQLYSLRDEMKSDYRGTVEKVAKMGYRAVEFAGYGGLSPADMKALLDDNGLEAFGAHVGLAGLENDMDSHIEMNTRVGNRFVICPYADIKTREDTLRLAEALNKCNEKLRAAGLSLGYHNHAHEFVKDGDDYLLDILFANVDKTVFAEIDVFWVAYAGVDPLAYIAKYPGRQPLMHLKELAADGKANVEIGSGVIDFSALIKAGKELGTTRFVVEQEEYTVPPLESCKASLDALLKL